MEQNLFDLTPWENLSITPLNPKRNLMAEIDDRIIYMKQNWTQKKEKEKEAKKIGMGEIV